MPHPTPIPTQLNIAPRGKTWKNWQLVDSTDGFPTRKAMEQFHCNPERVRELEECRVLNLNTIKQQAALIQLYESRLEAIGAGDVEPLRKQASAPQKFTSDSAMRRAFELEYGQSWQDEGWRREIGIWASAWHKATNAALATTQTATQAEQA